MLSSQSRSNNATRSVLWYVCTVYEIGQLYLFPYICTKRAIIIERVVKRARLHQLVGRVLITLCEWSTANPIVCLPLFDIIITTESALWNFLILLSPAVCVCVCRRRESVVVVRQKVHFVWRERTKVAKLQLNNQRLAHAAIAAWALWIFFNYILVKSNLGQLFSRLI